MKRVTLGDTIDFITTVHDVDGTSIEDASVTLKVYDSTGSLVLSDTISHTSGGTYVETKATDGWGTGGIRQEWTIESSSGTKSIPVEDEIRIASVGATTSTYIDVGELQSYFSRITDYLDNKSEDKVIAAYKYENRLLEGLGYSTPRPKTSDGFYDQSLRDFNAWESIYRIVEDNQITQAPSDENGERWYDGFKHQASMVYDDWKSKKITFTNEVSPGEAGIEPATRTVGSSAGTMLNNHSEAYGSGFTGADFQRDWSVEITGTGTAGELRECSYKWSNDGGLGTTVGTTTDGWTHLANQCYIRFTRGTSTGTNNIFVVGNKWTWKTTPTKYSVGGNNSARSYG